MCYGAQAVDTVEAACEGRQDAAMQQQARANDSMLDAAPAQHRKMSSLQHGATPKGAKARVRRNDLHEIGRQFAVRSQQAVSRRTAAQLQQAPTFIVCVSPPSPPASVERDSQCRSGVPSAGARQAPCNAMLAKPWQRRGPRQKLSPSQHVQIYTPQNT